MSLLLQRRLAVVFTLLASLVLGACALPRERLPAADILSASQPAQGDTTIALLGGTGMTGGYLLQEALSRGYRLRVLSRSPEKLAFLGDRITVVAGDARDSAVIDELLRGSDLVISAIGPARADGATAYGISSTVTANVLAAMSRQGLSRYLVVSGAGVEMPGDQRNLTGWLIRQLAKIRYPQVLADKQLEYRRLAESQLSWTLVRCPLIESRPFRQAPEVSLQTPLGYRLRAGELAHFVFEALETGTYLQSAPFLSSH